MHQRWLRLPSSILPETDELRITATNRLWGRRDNIVSGLEAEHYRNSAPHGCFDFRYDDASYTPTCCTRELLLISDASWACLTTDTQKRRGLASWPSQRKRWVDNKQLSTENAVDSIFGGIEQVSKSALPILCDPR